MANGVWLWQIPPPPSKSPANAERRRDRAKFFQETNEGEWSRSASTKYCVSDVKDREVGVGTFFIKKISQSPERLREFALVECWVYLHGLTSYWWSVGYIPMV